MKYFTASIIIALLCVLSIPAQSNTQRKFKHNDKIITNYDKSKNQTTVLLKSDFSNAFSGGADGVSVISLLAGFSYPGEEKTGTPKAVEFVLETMGSRERTNKLNLPDLIAEIDDTKFNLGKPRLIGITAEDASGKNIRVSFVREKIGILLPVDIFQKIASAKAVELQSGNMKVILKERHLEALRDLANRIN